MKNRIVPATSREVNIDADYLCWGLGRDILEIRKKHKWGSGIMDQISLDLKAEFPGEKGFSPQNLYRMAKFYDFYSDEDVIFSQL
jgi:hypothetical protein